VALNRGYVVGVVLDSNAYIMAALLERAPQSSRRTGASSPFSGSRRKRMQTEGSGTSANWSDDEDNPMLALSWYHPYLTRHAADCMLIDNAPEGSYLLRPSSNHKQDLSYVLSAKLSSSVQHVKVSNSEGKLLFGNSTFDSVESFKKHFEKEKPIIGSDSGITVVLKFPYKRVADKDEGFYTDVVHHAVTNMAESTSESDEELAEEMASASDPRTGVTSKEGFLVKEGKIRKSWKTRWFVLRGARLSYYRSKESRFPIDIIDLSLARAVGNSEYKQKQHCFSVELPRRTYYFQASGVEDRQQWVEILTSQVRALSSLTM